MVPAIPKLIIRFFVIFALLLTLWFKCKMFILLLNKTLFIVINVNCSFRKVKCNFHNTKHLKLIIFDVSQILSLFFMLVLEMSAFISKMIFENLNNECV